MISKKFMGERLKTARTTSHEGFVKCTRDELCERLTKLGGKPLAISTYKQWEIGVNGISIEWIPYICEALCCDVGYLYGECEEFRKPTSDMCELTGLSKKSIENLMALKNFYAGQYFSNGEYDNYTPLKVMDSILSNDDFYKLVSYIAINTSSKMLAKLDFADLAAPYIIDPVKAYSATMAAYFTEISEKILMESRQPQDETGH